MSRIAQLGQRLYQGDVSIDFVGRRKQWYAASAVILILAIAALLLRGLNFGIEFRGGVEFNAQIANPSSQVETMTDAVVDSGIEAAQNPVVVPSGDDALRIQTEPLTLNEQQALEQQILDAGATEANPSSIGPTWGETIANRALIGLLVFVFLVVVFIWAYFREWRMSVGGIVALIHDLVITVGVYALSGFEVTPASVTGFLTILGYSLYDTVVVFDKVRENTKNIVNSTRHTYAEAANLAVNQTLVRSINTSIAALLPVGAILYVGTFQLGSGPLKDLALALFVGTAAGTYSSIFIATPLVAQLKMQEPAMVAQEKRVKARRAQVARGAEPARTPAVVVTSSGNVDAPDSDALAEPDHTARSTPRPATRPRPSTRPTSTGAAKRAQPQRQARSKRGKP